MTSRWGPPTWNLFHTIIEKVKDEEFLNIKNTLFHFIRRICSILPCPDCSAHATLFLSKVNPDGIKTREDFRNMLAFFHNVVNRRRHTPMINITSILETYKTNNLIVVYNTFIKEFNTRGNIKLMSDSMQRRFVVSDFRKWIMTNITKFS